MNHSSTFYPSSRRALRGTIAMCFALGSWAFGAAMAVEQATTGVDAGRRDAPASSAGRARDCPPGQRRVGNECKSPAGADATGLQTQGVRPPRVLCDQPNGCKELQLQPLPKDLGDERGRLKPVPLTRPAPGR